MDIAYQKYVLEHCGITVTGTYLVCINSDYVRGEKLDHTRLFKIVDMTPWVELEAPLIPSRLALASKEEPTCDIGEHCITRKNLLGYCKLDTYAMVRVLEALVKAVELEEN